MNGFEEFMDSWLKRFSADDAKPQQQDPTSDITKLNQPDNTAKEEPVKTEPDYDSILQKFAPVYTEQQSRIKALEVANQQLAQKLAGEDKPQPKSKIDREELLKRVNENFVNGLGWAYQQEYGYDPAQVLPVLANRLQQLENQLNAQRFITLAKDYDDSNQEHFGALQQVHSARRAPNTPEELHTSWILAKHNNLIKPHTEEPALDLNPSNIQRMPRRSAPSPSTSSAEPSFKPNPAFDQAFEGKSLEEQRAILHQLQAKLVNG